MYNLSISNNIYEFKGKNTDRQLYRNKTLKFPTLEKYCCFHDSLIYLNITINVTSRKRKIEKPIAKIKNCQVLNK